MSPRLANNVENGIQTGTANLSLSGNELDNRLTGNSGNSVLYGLSGHDIVNGGAGDDILWGGNGNDTLIGGAGSDILHGEDGGAWDVAGDDKLSGGDGDDTLNGHEGNDILNGGAGADTLSGHSGADTFLYTDRVESGLGLELADMIVDFEIGTDVIDLRQIDANGNADDGDQAFIHVSSSTATAGELWIVDNSGGTYTLYADVDGGGADFQIDVTATGTGAFDILF